MIIEESSARLLSEIHENGPLMWTDERVPWQVADLACRGLVQPGPAPGSFEASDLGRSYAADVIDGRTP